jgi:hypothetical protein
MTPLPQQQTSWPIARGTEADPKATIRGRSRTIFLHYGGYPQLSRIAAYSDGLIQFGGIHNGFDFGGFVKAIHRGAISPLPGNSGTTFLFEDRLSGLGACVVDEFRPLLTSDDLIDWARSTIDEFNPSGTGLLDCGGIDYEPVDPRTPGIRQLRTVFSAAARYPKYDETGREIPGQPYRVAYLDDRDWSITDWMIYADGTAQLGPTGAIVDFRAVVELGRAGRVTSSVPDGQWMSLCGLGLLRPRSTYWRIGQQALLVEAEDILARLQGKEGCVDFCLRALRYHLENTSPESLDLLREAYDLVPAHLREIGLREPEHQIRRLLLLAAVDHVGRG